MGAAQSTAPQGQRPSTARGSMSSSTCRPQSRKESEPPAHGFRLWGSGSETSTRPRSGSFGRSFLSKSSHSRLAASKGLLHPSRSSKRAEASRRESSDCATPMTSDGSLTPTNPAYYDSTSRGRRAGAEAGAEGKPIHRSRSQTQQLLFEALSVAAEGFQQERRQNPAPLPTSSKVGQDEHRQPQDHHQGHQPQRHPTHEPVADSSPERRRSKSPAVPFRQRPKTQDEEEEEINVAHAEKMYDRATWRMYDRIMMARARQQQEQQQQQAALAFANKAMGQDLHISANMQPKNRQPLFRGGMMPNVPAADALRKEHIDGPPNGEDPSYPRVFSLDMDH